MKPHKPLASCLCLFCSAVFLIVLGLVLIFTWPHLLKYTIDTNLVLTPQSEIFNLWKTVPFALPIDFYIYNWTNPEDIYNQNVKPKFQQVGPYKFLLSVNNRNITWNKNGTITFRHQKFWQYNEKYGDLQDKITTINSVALSAAHIIRSWNYLARKSLSLSLSSTGSSIAVTRTVNELLFEGYLDPIVKMANSLPFLPSKFVTPWDKVGWFYMRNGSVDYEGVFNMGTGKNSVLGKLYSWNYWTKTPYYEGTCGQVAGSGGEFYGTNLGKDSIQMFMPDLCRVLKFNYVEEKYVDGILGYKYEINHLLDNGTLYLENKCFCGGECVPSGLLNVSSCKYDSPSFISLPHFYNADPYYINAIEGIEPAEKDKHEFSITIEPASFDYFATIKANMCNFQTTGVPLEVYARMQGNILLHSVPAVSLLENVPKVFIPIMWSEQKTQVPAKEIFKLKLLLKVPIICSSTGILLIIMGVVLLSLTIYKRNSTKRKHALNNEQSVPIFVPRREGSIIRIPNIKHELS